MKTKIFSSTSLIEYFVILIFLYPVFFNKIYYQTNDDRGIELIANGVLYENSSSDLVFISKWIGIVLEKLYSFDLNFSWYLIGILLTQAVSVLLYLKLIRNLELSITSNIILILPIIIFFGIFYSIQYTQTALVAGAMGTLSLLFEKKRVNLVIAGMLVFVGVSWRPSAAFVGIALTIAIIGVFEIRALITKRLIFVLSISAISMLLFLTFFSSWSPWISPEEREFAKFNSARGSIQTYVPNEATDQHLRKLSKKIRWSNNDYRLSQEKSYSYDPEIYNTPAYLFLEKNREIVPSYRHYIETLKNLFFILKKDYLFLTSMFLFAMFVTAIHLKQFKILQMSIFIMGIIFLMYFILLMGKLPERLFWPIGFAALAGFVFLSVKQCKNEPNKIKILPFVIIGLIVFPSANFHQKLIENENWWKYAQEEQILGFDQLLSFKPDKPIIAFSSFYTPLWKTSNPLIGPSGLPEIWYHLIPIGWVNQSPDMNQHLKRLGISEDLFLSIAEGDAYLAVGDIEDLQMVTEFLRQHRNIEVEWPKTPFVYNESGLAIWKAESVN